MTESASETELGLWPRLIAGAWFAGAALLPVIFFFIKFGGLLLLNCAIALYAFRR
jgi:hypothetical protein